MNGWKEQTALSLVSCLSPQSAARGVGEFENPRKNTAEIVDYMDWNLKTSCWDLTGFEQDVIPKMDAFDRPTIFQDYRTRSDFSVDLRLGEAGNSSDESLSKWQGASKIESSASGSAKKARGANKGTQAVSCLVDGCDADLSRCRDYHRRHKVCEIHSKSPQVTVGGQKQRFCQQCSRFHSPEEFDEGKRSCRKRLDGHNRRRRKPRPDPHSDPGSFFSHYQGTQSLPFSGAQAYPSPNVVNPTWLGVANTEAGGRHYNLHQRVELLDRPSLFLGPSLNSYKGGKQVTFLEGDSPMATNLTNQTTAEASVCQPLLATIASLENNGSNHNRFRNKLTTQVCDADCALSLLSSMQMQTPGNHMMQPNSILSASLNAQSLEPVDLVLVSDGNNADAAAADGHSNCSGILPLQPEAESSCGNKASHSLPFHWN